MGDVVERMLRDTITALMTGDRKLVAAISRMDNTVDRLHEAIKLYVTKVTRETLMIRTAAAHSRSSRSLSTLSTSATSLTRT